MQTATTTNTSIQWRKPPKFNLTQHGNAQRLVHEHSSKFRFCMPWKKWLMWDGKRWVVDETAAVHRLAVETVKSIRRESKKISDGTLRSQMERHARSSESAYNLRAILELAQKEEGISVLPGEFDEDPMLFNCLNGTLDLRTGALRPHSREDLLMKLAPVEYRPDAECPTWRAFLNRNFDKDHTLIWFLQKAIGYSLTGSVEEKSLFFFHGSSGDNGKTTLLEAIRKIMGDYAGTIDIEALMKNAQTSEKERATADLVGKRFVTSSEAAEGEALNEAKIKHLTGTAKLSGRQIYGSKFEFDPQFKLFIDANHKPRISGTENAIWNRFRLIPFNVSIPEKEQDKKLLARLAAEAPGILAWAVQGCLWWQKEGLGAPEVVEQATEGYRDEMDPVTEFIEDCCIVDPETRTPFQDLYRAYVDWCRTYREKLLSQKSFATALDRKGYAPVRDAKGRYRKGLRLLHEPARDTAYPA